MLTLLAATAFSNGLVDRRKWVTERGLYFVAPQTTCDCLSACRCPRDLHLFNPRFPTCLHRMICTEVQRGH